jgi:hypothetical protein
MTQSRILSVHLEKAHDEQELIAALCSLFGLQPRDLAALDTMTTDTRVPYQLFQRPRGFRTTLELYVGRAPQGVPRSDFDLAEALSRRFGERVLIPPRDYDPNPNVWDLVTPNDAARRVHGVVQDDDEAIVLDEDTRGAG